jgi:hypothetical protein
LNSNGAAVMPATPATTTFSSPASTSTSHETPPLQQPANPLQPSSGDYATTTAIPLDGELALTAQTLLAWLQSQLTEGESVGQVFIEPDGTHSDYETSVDAEGNESQVCDFNPRQVVRRRDRARRRRFTLRCLLQRSPTRRTAGRVAGRMGRHRGDAVSYLQHHLSTVERGALGTFRQPWLGGGELW